MSQASTLSESLADVLPQCRQRQQAWAALPVRQRLQPVRALRRLLVERWEELCTAVAQDIGKPVAETLAAEILPLAEACRFLEREAARLLTPRVLPRRRLPWWLWPQSDTVHRRPRGLVGILGTWNFPLLLNGAQLLQALTAGNAVLWKPSELAPASAWALADLLERAAFPAGLVHILEATREAGRELAETDVDHLILTGSDATGRRLAERLGARLVSSTLELSGCDALFLLEDGDVSLAARAAWYGATFNRGQTCLAVRRAFVHKAHYAAFEAALGPLVAAAAPVPLALASQARQAEELAAAAVAAGARLLEGPAADGLCPVRVLFDAAPEMAVCQQSCFAPLLAVLPFSKVEEALRMNEACPFGLGASIFTRDAGRAGQMAAAVRAGMVTVNDVIVPTAHPATPFGGRGRSGWGVTQGAEGLLEMTVPQVVSVRGGAFRPHYEPPGASRFMGVGALRGLLEWGHGATLRQRWRGLWRLLGALRGGRPSY
jgi:acyl-CoA reductase-like NAD-dependent aldehyde dehydrogenase